MCMAATIFWRQLVPRRTSNCIRMPGGVLVKLPSSMTNRLQDYPALTTQPTLSYLAPHQPHVKLHAACHVAFFFFSSLPCGLGWPCIMRDTSPSSSLNRKLYKGRLTLCIFHLSFIPLLISLLSESPKLLERESSKF